MTTGFTLDTSQWRDAVKEYLKLSSRSLPEVINKNMGFIARKAWEYTKEADVTAIKKKFESGYGGGQRVRINRKTGRISIDKKSGKWRTDQMYTRMAWAIAWKKRDDLPGKTLYKKVRSFVGKTKSHVGYIKSGWIPAIRLFNPNGGWKNTAKNSKKYFTRVDQYGKGILAKEGTNPTAVIENAAGMGLIEAGAHTALQRALNEEAQNLRNMVAKRLQQLADKQKKRGK